MHSSDSWLTHPHLPWARLSVSSSDLGGDESNLSQIASVWKRVALASFRACVSIILTGRFMQEGFSWSQSARRLSDPSPGPACLWREAHVAIGRHQKAAVNRVNKWMKRTGLWCKQQVLLLLSGGIVSEPEPDPAPGGGGVSQWVKQQGESETWLCDLPLPPRASITPGTSPLAGGLPSQLGWLVFLYSISSSGEGLRFTAAGGIRGTTNTRIIGCRFAEQKRQRCGETFAQCKIYFKALWLQQQSLSISPKHSRLGLSAPEAAGWRMKVLPHENATHELRNYQSTPALRSSSELPAAPQHFIFFLRLSQACASFCSI